MPRFTVVVDADADLHDRMEDTLDDFGGAVLAGGEGHEVSTLTVEIEAPDLSVATRAAIGVLDEYDIHRLRRIEVTPA